MRIHKVQSWLVSNGADSHFVYTQSAALDAFADGYNIEWRMQERVCVEDRDDYVFEFDGKCYMCIKEVSSV